MGAKIQGMVDWLLGKFFSKKLMVFIIATFLIFYDKLDSENWVILAIVYLSAQGAVDVVLTLKGLKNN